MNSELRYAYHVVLQFVDFSFSFRNWFVSLPVGYLFFTENVTSVVAAGNILTLVPKIKSNQSKMRS